MRNVLFVSAYADFRDLYTLGLRHAGLWAEAIAAWGEAEAVLQRIHVDTLTFHLGRDKSAWSDCALLVKTAHPVPLILLTGWIYLDGHTARKAFDIGCAAFVIEPCLPVDLVGIIERVVSGERNIEWPPRALSA